MSQTNNRPIDSLPISRINNNFINNTCLNSMSNHQESNNFKFPHNYNINNPPKLSFTKEVFSNCQALLKSSNSKKVFNLIKE